MLENQTSFRSPNSPLTSCPDPLGNTPNSVPSVDTRSSLALPSSTSEFPNSASDYSVISSTVDYSEFLLPQSVSCSGSASPYVPDLSVPLSAPDPKTGQVTLANGWTPMFGRSSTLYGRNKSVSGLQDIIEQNVQLRNNIENCDSGKPFDDQSPTSDTMSTHAVNNVKDLIVNRPIQSSMTRIPPLRPQDPKL